MTFTVNSVSRCASGNHWTIVLTAGGQSRTLVLETSDLQLDFSSYDQVREAVIGRMRSAAKEAGAGTLAQVKTALEGKSFQL